MHRLKKSPKNARKTPHPKADIEAIGEGRRLAHLLRAKRKEITKAEQVRRILDTAHNAHEISLAENVIRSTMHPADQFEAFARLHHEEGMAAEDIAARFGVTAAVVKQHLKLGAISPKLMQAYRDEELTLEEPTAFAITDDHARQEQV
ncbi:hypothetical protein [Bradyrhizobium sp. I1.7.5]|uniref:ParB/RepB/Spo0J family partition protein n=1 Tax=Bradyrhizobium sp. I1.7.5 TaxID=3156363 RepID=UPI003390BA35